MSGLEPLIASAFASVSAAAAPAAGAATAATAAGAATAATAAGATGLAAGTAGAVGASAAAAGLTTAEIAALAAAGASVAGTGAALLEEKPKVPELAVATRDDAAREAELRSELYKKRGRAAALLTEGGGRGDTSSPYLGAAELVGA